MKRVIRINRRYGGIRRRGRYAVLSLWIAASCLTAPISANGPGISVYDAVSVESSVTLHTEFLTEVKGPESAAGAIWRQATAMTDEQKRNPADIEQAELFAEAAVAEAASKQTVSPLIAAAQSVKNAVLNANAPATIRVSAESISTAVEKAGAIRDRAAQALTENGIAPRRKIASTAVIETTASAFTLILHSDILDTAAEKIRVTKTNAPEFSLTFRPDDFREELRPDPENPEPRTLAIAVQLSAEECEPGTDVPIPKVKIDVPGGQLSAPITLSFPPGSNEPSALAVTGATGEAAVSRYNPASRTLDARLDSSDVYTFGKRNVYFTDLLEKDRKVRLAVEALARVNVVYGYADHTFRPEQAVTRAEFVAFVMRVLGRVNNSLKSPFVDVTETHGCYHEIASAYYYGIIKGYDAENFCGEKLITKTQIYTILGRILEREMGYWTPENPGEYLSGEFTDTVDEWAWPEVALATREGLVIRQSTGAFDGQRMMNRGDVALIIYGLYQRLA